VNVHRWGRHKVKHLRRSDDDGKHLLSCTELYTLPCHTSSSVDIFFLFLFVFFIASKGSYKITSFQLDAVHIKTGSLVVTYT
jgi:hypothetical protein